jgi:hypothetical protein
MNHTNEVRIKETLEEAIGWKRAKADNLMGHDDCQAHAATAYLYNLVYGFPIIRPELSVMIREGNMTREAAMARLHIERCAVDLDENSLAILCEMTGFHPKSVIGFARRAKRALWCLRAFLNLRNILFPRQDISVPLDCIKSRCDCTLPF